MKRIHWLLITLAFITTLLIFTIATFDPTCHIQTDNQTEDVIRLG